VDLIGKLEADATKSFRRFKASIVPLSARDFFFLALVLTSVLPAGRLTFLCKMLISKSLYQDYCVVISL